MRRRPRRFGLKHSLLNKYLLIVLCAIVLLPFAFPLIGILLSVQNWRSDIASDSRYRDGAKLMQMWHGEAAKLGGAAPGEIDTALRRLQADYPKLGMFWVDGAGQTRLKLPVDLDVPDSWDPSYTVQFMKERTGGPIFTVVAFIGSGRNEGFMVMQLPRTEMDPVVVAAQRNYGTIYLLGILLMLGLFLAVSLVFFLRIRRRLVRLQCAMAWPTDGGVPRTVAADRDDEIGRLEQAFNEMIRKLEASRAREAAETELRQDLIAKLSHDLRTPLTTIRGHAYSLRQEELSDRGRESLDLIDRKIGYLGQLIDNLFSYSLLSSGRYPHRPQRLDIVRLARTHFAGWYPVFEQEGFEVDTELPDSAVYWEVDPERMERVLDNYLQNVLRHARDGRYVALRVSAEADGAIEIADRGPGMQGPTASRGAGMGLSIAALMLKDMQLRADVRSGPSGTTVRIVRRPGLPASVPQGD
ncbi:HAMP domain-containing sensor histidine kinase [Cohnella sp. REN36]|uniref:HAMP domain-containing sensor histidine kinase n=1 Tax=Cohnella sp. REN36 TaxID=2887347 RepID=UPI001D14AE81|nr:HAMP domain-containing sensor histidine kinase [Cohnella sp. REN36]MCC3376520.1 HAMP domain-containing histidine kinase [Cohnella sp. REN36]